MLLVDFINVGYGDATLIRDDNFTLLVDCGDTNTGLPYAGSRRISATDFLLKAGIHRLDLLVLSHLHRDHSGGLLDICRNFEIGEFWTSYLPPKGLQKKVLPQNSDWGKGINNIILALHIYTRALECLHKKDTSIRLVQNQTSFIAPGEKLKIECVCAETALYQRQQEILDRFILKADAVEIFEREVVAELDEVNKFINNTSLRISIQYGNCVILLPGDVSAEYWMRNPPGLCNILKAPHHGHSDAVNDELLQILQPEYAVVSVSNDRQDGCPDKAIVAMISRYVKECFFTDAMLLSDDGSEKSLRYSVQFRVEGTGIIEYQPILS